MKAKEMAMAASTLRYIGLEGTADTFDKIRKEWPMRHMDAASVRNLVKLIVYGESIIPRPCTFFNDNDKKDARIGIRWKYKDDSDYEIVFNVDDSADFSAKVNDGSPVHIDGRLHAVDALDKLLTFLKMRKDDLWRKETKKLERDINDMKSRTDKVEQEINKQGPGIEKLKRRIEEKSKQATVSETKDAPKQKTVSETKDAPKQEAAAKEEN